MISLKLKCEFYVAYNCCMLIWCTLFLKAQALNLASFLKAQALNLAPFLKAQALNLALFPKARL